MKINLTWTIPLACVLLSLAAMGSAISPRFDERAYTPLTDSPTTRQYFSSWTRFHQRSYESDEFGYRYNVWRDNYAYIEHFNANANASFTLAMNAMGDLTREEIISTFTGLLPSTPSFDRRAYEEAETVAKREIAERSIPTSYDWRTEGAVTAVKNQGSCGDCYSFSATGSLEGVNKISTGTLTSLSEQMILDCAEGTGNIGCSGGNMEITYMWMIDHNGGAISTEASYPYTGTEGTCLISSSTQGAVIKSYRSVTSGSESDLLTKAAAAPVSVGINASPLSFAYYSSGTLNDPTCTSTGLNHAVTVVGWGTDSSGNEYWLIKNSWGTSWGLSGYAQIARNAGNMCGIATMASQPCYNSDCTFSSSTVSSSPLPSPAQSPAQSPAAKASPSPSSAAQPSPSSSPSSCTCPCSCK